MNVLREEHVEDWANDESSSLNGVGSWLFPACLIVDMIILLFFFVELAYRLRVKINGSFNVFAYSLKEYNHRFRKLGQRHFEKHRIRPHRPWYMTIYCTRQHVAQLKKEYEENRSVDAEIQAKVPYNFLANNHLLLIVFELIVVSLSILTCASYMIINAEVNSFDSSHKNLGNDPEAENWEHVLEWIVKANSILRMLRLLRVVLRTKKLRRLAKSLLKSFHGVFWILVNGSATSAAIRHPADDS